MSFAIVVGAWTLQTHCAEYWLGAFRVELTLRVHLAFVQMLPVY